MLTIEESNVLGGIIDTTWCRSSAISGKPASVGIKWQLLGEDQLIATCSMVVHLSAPQELRREKDRYTQEATTILNNQLSEIKKEFKEQSGRTLKAETKHSDASVEPYYGVPGPALFRLKAIIDLD